MWKESGEKTGTLKRQSKVLIFSNGMDSAKQNFKNEKSFKTYAEKNVS